jgi:predicted mannosyl-3-phosphoglycerate phosphatase (HAD superfamily)
MKQFEVHVTKVPHRDVREASRIISDFGKQGYEVVFCTMVGNMELLVMLQREIETLGKVVAKAKSKTAKPKPRTEEEKEKLKKVSDKEKENLEKELKEAEEVSEE